MPFPATRRRISSPCSLGVEYEAEALQSLGSSVCIIGSAENRVGVGVSLTRSQLKFYQIRTFASKQSLVIPEILYSVAALFLTLRIRSRFDFILYNSYPAAFLAIASSMLIRSLRNNIVVQHGGLEEIYQRRVATLSYILKKFALPRAHLVFTQSNTVKRGLVKRFGVHESKIVVLPIMAGIDTNTFRPKQLDTRLKEKMGVRDSERIILCVGGLSPRKNQLTVLKAFTEVLKETPNCRLVLIGATVSKSYSERLERFVAQERIQNNVTFIGYVNNYSDLVDYYNLADFHILVSYDEGGLPRATMEAMSCEKACIVSLREFNLEYVQSNEVMMVDPDDAPAIAKAMLHLLSDIDLRNELGTRGRRLMMKYNWLTLSIAFLARLAEVRV